jgi:hypothetical protein
MYESWTGGFCFVLLILLILWSRESFMKSFIHLPTILCYYTW